MHERDMHEPHVCISHEKEIHESHGHGTSMLPNVAEHVCLMHVSLSAFNVWLQHHQAQQAAKLLHHQAQQAAKLALQAATQVKQLV
jgi:hypothetical protein